MGLSAGGLTFGSLVVKRIAVLPDCTVRLVSDLDQPEQVSAQSLSSDSQTAALAAFHGMPQIGALAGAPLVLKNGGQASLHSTTCVKSVFEL